MSQDEDLVAFFFALPEARRREYEALAERDRRFGEDVEAEVRADGRGGGDANGGKPRGGDA